MRRVLMTLAAAILTAAAGVPALAQEGEEFYPPGEAVLTVVKFVEDEDEDEDGAALFDFEVDCEAAGTLAFALGHEDTETITVPIGDVCKLTELGVDPLDVAFLVAPPEAEVSRDPEVPSVTVEVADAAGVLISVFNAFDEILGPATLELEKDLAATSERSRRAFAGTGYVFRVVCATFDEVVALKPGETFRWEGIPVGTQCVITETDTHDAVATSITVQVDGEVVRTVSGVEVVVDFPAESDVLVQALYKNTPREQDPPPEQPRRRDVTQVLARTGFDLTWGMLLALGLMLGGGTALYTSRRRRRGR
jgi:LPXTG-motif cell wall-anchored protein